jgi:hypothetical protein
MPIATSRRCSVCGEGWANRAMTLRPTTTSRTRPPAVEVTNTPNVNRPTRRAGRSPSASTAAGTTVEGLSESIAAERLKRREALAPSGASHYQRRSPHSPVSLLAGEREALSTFEHCSRGSIRPWFA